MQGPYNQIYINDILCMLKINLFMWLSVHHPWYICDAGQKKVSSGNAQIIFLDIFQVKKMSN